MIPADVYSSKKNQTILGLVCSELFLLLSSGSPYKGLFIFCCLLVLLYYWNTMMDRNPTFFLPKHDSFTWILHHVVLQEPNELRCEEAVIKPTLSLPADHIFIDSFLVVHVASYTSYSDNRILSWNQWYRYFDNRQQSPWHKLIIIIFAWLPVLQVS